MSRTIFLNIFNIGLAFLISCVCIANGSADLTMEPGHLKKFGTGRPIHEVDETLKFPDPESFFKSYFLAQKPLKIKGGAAISPAYKLWTDEYFTSLQLPKNSDVILETVKKESRVQNSTSMNFQKFVSVYLNSSYYMVDSLPKYLKPDIVLPFSIQCPEIIQKTILEIMMWFSSGGTNSVVHFDYVDNFNCVYRGMKDFVMIDPEIGMPLIDHMEGVYSDIDVDAMDYVKYPQLAKVEYIHAHLDPGDCLYIPLRWIHQVRSYNSNLAVNIWWNNAVTKNLVDVSTCNKEFDDKITVDTVNIIGLDNMADSSQYISERIEQLLMSQQGYSMISDDFVDYLIPKIKALDGVVVIKEEIDAMRGLGEIIVKIFDKNNDGFVELNDMKELTGGDMIDIMSIFHSLEKIEESIDAIEGVQSEDTNREEL